MANLKQTPLTCVDRRGRAEAPNSLRGIVGQIVGFSVLGLQEDASLLYVLVILPALAVALVVSSIGQRLPTCGG